MSKLTLINGTNKPKAPIDPEMPAYSVLVKTVSNGWIVTIFDFEGNEFSEIFKHDEGALMLNAISAPLGFEYLGE